MHNFLPEQVFVAFSISFWDETEIIEWAEQQVSKYKEIDAPESLLEIAWLNSHRPRESENAGRYLAAYVLELDPDFKVSDHEALAKQMLATRIRQSLKGECHPYELCRMVGPIENEFDYPKWLGDLYNACDWCRPNSNPNDYSYIQQAAKEVLNVL